LKEHSTINSANEYEPDVLNAFVQDGFKTAKFYKECMSSLALLPPRNFAVFERQYLLEYYTQKTKNFTMYKVSLALYLPRVNLYLICRDGLKCRFGFSHVI